MEYLESSDNILRKWKRSGISLQLREEDLPPVGVGRHGAPLGTPHLKAASGAAEGEGGTGAGRGGEDRRESSN